MGQPSSRWAHDSGGSVVRHVRLHGADGYSDRLCLRGQGPALLVPAAWISHLELLWQDPAYRAFFAPLAAARTVVRVTGRDAGCPNPGRRGRISTPT